MFYITGDTHGSFERIDCFVQEKKLTQKDCIIIHGDSGFNYFLDHRDTYLKHKVNGFGPKLFCIRGNHEERPENISTYTTASFCGGTVFCEPSFPNLLFAKDGEVYNVNGKATIVIGGAYSIDKQFRLAGRGHWFASEQLTKVEMSSIEKTLSSMNWKVDCVLSHTAPEKYEPRELLLSFIDQSTVDKTMELWLDKVEDRLAYKEWYFGHYHGDKKVNSSVTMLYRKIQKFS